MSRTDESVIVRASMRALEYREEAWEAHDRHVAPPDPSLLSDRALYAVSQYDGPDLPTGTHEALEAECKRRGLAHDRSNQITVLVMLALMGLGGALIWWVLLVP